MTGTFRYPSPKYSSLGFSPVNAAVASIESYEIEERWNISLVGIKAAQQTFASLFSSTIREDHPFGRIKHRGNLFQILFFR
jgi:hypothetical protein